MKCILCNFEEVIFCVVILIVDIEMLFWFLICVYVNWKVIVILIYLYLYCFFINIFFYVMLLYFDILFLIFGGIWDID